MEKKVRILAKFHGVRSVYCVFYYYFFFSINYSPAKNNRSRSRISPDGYKYETRYGFSKYSGVFMLFINIKKNFEFFKLLFGLYG